MSAEDLADAWFEERVGRSTVTAALSGLLAAAREAVRQILDQLGEGFQKLVTDLDKEQIEFDLGCEDIIARHGVKRVVKSKSMVSEEIGLSPALNNLIARAIDRWHVYDLWSAGCRDIIRETYDSSIRMGRSANGTQARVPVSNVP